MSGNNVSIWFGIFTLKVTDIGLYMIKVEHHWNLLGFYQKFHGVISKKNFFWIILAGYYSSERLYTVTENTLNTENGVRESETVTPKEQTLK